MLWPARIRRDERQVDLVLLGRRERNLGLLCFFLDALDRIRLRRKIDAAVLLEFDDDPINEDIVPVVTAKVAIPVRRPYLKHATAALEHRHIERPAAQLLHGDLLVFLL